ncbi:Hepatocyte growth factor-regulated tyrosine kinase substrate [Toxocara canis]|uniref:Hepatocyte growth factor-regulated tyrosine kinase substrate n=1 Tax=Toxocara canis TaxID=6265 RepID=A0A0B2VPT7_TOXCA|nr:Hepatocyte growth factor-regulated tyrosine kinase substrate [Toxocara canis]
MFGNRIHFIFEENVVYFSECKECSSFVFQLRERTNIVHIEVTVMDNRIRSNIARNRSIVNDTAIQSLFIRLTEMHAQVMARMNKLEDRRNYFESLQDHLAHIQEARQAVNALREDYERRKQERAVEEQRLRQQEMQQKVDLMRQKKHELLLHQRHLALLRFQQQEQELQMRRMQQAQHGAVQQPSCYYTAQPGMPPGYVNSTTTALNPSGVVQQPYYADGIQPYAAQQYGYPTSTYVDPNQQRQLAPPLGQVSQATPQIQQSVPQVSQPVPQVPQVAAQISQPVQQVGYPAQYLGQSLPAQDATVANDQKTMPISSQPPMHSVSSTGATCNGTAHLTMSSSDPTLGNAYNGNIAHQSYMFQQGIAQIPAPPQVAAASTQQQYTVPASLPTANPQYHQYPIVQNQPCPTYQAANATGVYVPQPLAQSGVQGEHQQQYPNAGEGYYQGVAVAQPVASGPNSNYLDPTQRSQPAEDLLISFD